MIGPEEPIRDYRHIWSAARAVAAGAAGAAAGARPGRRRRRRRNALTIMTLSVSVLTLVLLLYPLADATTLPPDVYGAWRTDAVGYEQRRFELRAHSLTFQVANLRSAVSRYGISRVRQSETSTGTLFRVEYFGYDDEATSVPLTFEFTYRAAIPSEIVFAHQSGIVWTREPPAPPAKPPAAADDEPEKPVPVTKRP